MSVDNYSVLHKFVKFFQSAVAFVKAASRLRVLKKSEARKQIGFPLRVADLAILHSSLATVHLRVSFNGSEG